MKPLVSIPIPAFNEQEWIADTLKSAIGQTWERKEVIMLPQIRSSLMWFWCVEKELDPTTVQLHSSSTQKARKFFGGAGAVLTG